ncbi:MAG: hypothetical protein ACPMAQ_06305 [Phycisphaerae bacterium]
MSKREECVIDTMVLQKANAALTQQPAERSLFRRRLALLDRIQRGTLTVLISRQSLAEYERQVPSPRNDYIRAFFELIRDPVRRAWNWEKRWSGKKAKARKCRYPSEDDHVLRTAIRPRGSTIFTEEHRMLVADACIYRHFRVHIHSPA